MGSLLVPSRVAPHLEGPGRDTRPDCAVGACCNRCVPSSNEREDIVALLSLAGFVAAEEDAADLLACADGDTDRLGFLIERRLAGEPLAWITGHVSFCGLDIRVHPEVYVPRWQSEPLALRAASRLCESGVAIDLCTGSGAIAKILSLKRPRARVFGTDSDARAVACAADNGVKAFCGDLFTPLPAGLAGRADLVVGVVPYVPTNALELLPHDTFAFESRLAYDGGPDGTDVLRRVLGEASFFLRSGGALLLELGGEQAAALAGDLERLGYSNVEALLDDDGDLRGIEATLASDHR